MYFVLFYCSLFGLLVYNATHCTLVYSYSNMVTNNIGKEFGILDCNGPPKIPSQQYVAARGCYNFSNIPRAHYFFNTRHIDDPSFLRATKPANLLNTSFLGVGGSCLFLVIFVVFPNVNQLFPRRHCQHYIAISLRPN